MIIKKKSSLIILTFLMTVCIAIACAFMPKSVKASASTPSDGGEIVGASIRIPADETTTSTGIRFGYALDIDTLGITFDQAGQPNNIWNLRMDISIFGKTNAISFYENGVMTTEGGVTRKVNRGTLSNGEFEKDAAGDTLLCLIYIYNFTDVEDYATEITAKGYVQIGESGTLNDSATVTKSIREVAKIAYAEPEYEAHASLLENFFTKKASKELTLFDATEGTGEQTLAQVFGETLPAVTSAKAVSVVAAEETPVTTTVTYADGKITDVPVDSKTVVKQTITIETEDWNYQVTVSPYTKVISDKTELKAVFYDNNKTYSGHYILDANIDVQNDTSIVDRGAAYFNGTFDGNGYSIKNLKYRWHGLFGLIKTGATIKNVAFVDILPVLGGGYGGIGLIEGNARVDLSNVYMSYATCNLDNGSSPLNILSGYTGGVENYMNNVVIDISKVTLSNPYKVNLYAADLNGLWTNEGHESLYARTNERWQNIYLISKSPLMYQPTNPVRILDADNKKEDTSYYNPADASVTKEKLTFEGVFRYDTATAYVDATKGGVDSSFATSGYWTVDATNGLVWVGKAA